MSFTLPHEAKTKLEAAILDFVSNRTRTVMDVRRLTGYLNWALNVYPNLARCISIGEFAVP